MTEAIRGAPRRGALITLAVLTAIVVLPATAAVASQPAASTTRSGDAVATVSGSRAELSDSLVGRSWEIDRGLAGGIATTALTDEVTGQNWVNRPSPDFTVTLDGAPLSSEGAWRVLGVSTSRSAADPTRPDAPRAVQVRFRLATVPGLAAAGIEVPAGIEIDRTYTLYPGSAVIDV
ncbi:MAG: hypothetical protein ACYDD6_06215, partial [Acidimicrobiales bacterium]